MTKSIIDGIKTSTYVRVEDIIADLIDVILKAGTRHRGMMIHMETLIMNLTRSSHDVIVRADYGGISEPEIQFVKLTQAIQKSNLFSGVVFQDLRRQFELADTINKRSPGIFDIFFKNVEFLKNGEEFKRTRPYLYDRVTLDVSEVARKGKR
jgi:hypothetical protein